MNINKGYRIAKIKVWETFSANGQTLNILGLQTMQSLSQLLIFARVTQKQPGTIWRQIDMAELQ